eukprot:CAMPEP_0171091216 /NCGR_PEP_ID=MMETSP0766_2-20121228/32301_1 /TAXON_ID=439317 /ORGANISM="Gambierdiscus australes, Strain CAWD 149" /LENGTH=125 /DNA_ID=CAMNT_0011549291 /DNA_START=190 /DNA_END=567 /DNA_ORIENTATION=+
MFDSNGKLDSMPNFHERAGERKPSKGLPLSEERESKVRLHGGARPLAAQTAPRLNAKGSQGRQHLGKRSGMTWVRGGMARGATASHLLKQHAAHAKGMRQGGGSFPLPSWVHFKGTERAMLLCAL